jgi:hypothetical protein
MKARGTLRFVAGTLKFCICNDKKNACRIVVGFEMTQRQPE